MEMYFIGNVTREVRDQSMYTLGYRWKSVDVSDHEVVRSRDYAHRFDYEDGMPFSDIDPYRKLYDLVHFENASSFWRELKACQMAKSCNSAGWVSPRCLEVICARCYEVI